jgi:hypothetical protein
MTLKCCTTPAHFFCKERGQEPWQLSRRAVSWAGRSYFLSLNIQKIVSLRLDLTMVDPRQWWLHFLLAGLIWPVIAQADINCYNPDGSQANNDVPCTSDSTTFCCSKGDVCMSNGLCYLQGKRGFVLSRASCTDRSWNSCGSYTYCSKWKILQSEGIPLT